MWAAFSLAASCSVRTPAMTSQPLAARSVATQLPMPREAPVTRTELIGRPSNRRKQIREVADGLPVGESPPGDIELSWHHVRPMTHRDAVVATDDRQNTALGRAVLSRAGMVQEVEIEHDEVAGFQLVADDVE